MTQTVNGMVFNDPYEMNYEVLSLLELSVHNNGIVYDDVDGKMIFFNEWTVPVIKRDQGISP